MSSTTEQAPILSEEDLQGLEEPESDVIERGIGTINDVFRRIGATIAVVATVIVWTLLLVSVFMRYVTGSSIGFATELPAYLFPWMIAGGVIVAMSAAGHIAVDFFIARLNPRSLARMYVVIWLFSAALWGLMTVLCVRLVAPLSEQTTPILGWPMIGSFAAFIAMCICLTVQSLALAVHVARTGHTEHEEVLGV